MNKKCKNCFYLFNIPICKECHNKSRYKYDYTLPIVIIALTTIISLAIILNYAKIL